MNPEQLQAQLRLKKAKAAKKLRDTRKSNGLKEIRNCYIKPHHEQAVRDYAAELKDNDNVKT